MNTYLAMKKDLNDHFTIVGGVLPAGKGFGKLQYKEKFLGMC